MKASNKISIGFAVMAVVLASTDARVFAADPPTFADAKSLDFCET